MKVFHRLAAATAAVALMTGVAAAAPAAVEADLNMRSGPGTNFEVIETIPAGATVEVLGCTGSWCEVVFQGERGFASASYLEQGGGATVGYAAPPAVAYYDDPYYYDYGYGPAVGVGIYAGSTWHHGRHWRGDRWRDRRWADRNWRGDRNWQGGTPGTTVRGGFDGRVSGGATYSTGRPGSVGSGQSMGGRAAMGGGRSGGTATFSSGSSVGGGGAYSSGGGGATVSRGGGANTGSASPGMRQ